MNIRSNNSKAATRDIHFVWAKSVGEVPGKEMERWGLTVDAWGGFSSKGKTELALYEGTLDAHTYQDILQKKLLPAAQEWCSGRKGSVGTATRQGVFVTQQQSTERWLEQHGVDVVEGWPTKGDDM
jgi:hypothetical protein